MNGRSTATWKMVLPFFAVWLALLIFGMMHHEMWLDETHHWLLAKSSSSLLDLRYNARYDGHPLLWDTILFVVSRFSGSVYAMQFVHGLIASLLALLILRKFPAPFWQRVLIIFGYFFFYEYAVISRNYSLTLLLLFLIANFWEQRMKKRKLILFLLILLMQTHLLGTIAACIITAALISERVKKKEAFAKWNLVMIVAVSASGLVVYFTASPPADHFLFAHRMIFTDQHRWLSAAGMMLKGLFPVQNAGSEYPWNSNWFLVHMHKLIIVPAIASWMFPVVIFLRNRKALLLFYSGAILFCLFIGYTPVVIAVRYCGFLFAWMLFVFWIAGNRDARSEIQNYRLNEAALVFILLVQLVAGIIMWNIDRVRPFSNGKNVAEWINAHDPEAVVAVHEQFTGPTVAAYLDRKVYYPERKTFGDFCDWSVQPMQMSDELVLQEAYRWSDSTGKTIFLVMDHLSRLPPGPPVVFRGVMRRLDECGQFDGALVAAEDYYIYRIMPGDEL